MFTPNLARNKRHFTKKGVCLNNFFDGFGIILCASLFFPRLRKFWWSSRAEFDVFCEGFPQSSEVERLSRETRGRDIFPFYTSTTHLKPYCTLVFANLSYFSF